MLHYSKPLGLLSFLVLVGAAFAPATAGGEPRNQIRDYSYFLNRLVDLDGLPFLEEGITCKQFSSYDRKSRYDEATGKYIDWDANADYAQYLRVEGREAVMAEMKGPGCIYRIWSANPQGEVRFYLDGDTEPTFALPFADLFSGDVYPQYPFAPPLVWQRMGEKDRVARASHCYVPIPYAKSCKVTIYPRPTMYYIIGYQTFAPGTNIKTFNPRLTRSERATYERVRKILRNAFDAATMTTDAGRAEVAKSIGKKNKVPPDPQVRPGDRLWPRRKHRSEALAPGETAVVAELDGPAMITNFLAHVESRDPQAFRRILFQVYWDDEKRPAIEAPLADFFGSSFGSTTYHSIAMGKTDKWFYSRWRMPFRKRARFVVVNESHRPASVKVRVVRRKMSLPDNTAYFHARWRRDPFSKEFDYPFLECTGRGRFVGAAQFIHNVHGGWWGEGDEKVYVDGEKFPSSFGTGSEDYYGDAWGIRWYSNPYAGCPYSSTPGEDYPPGEMQSCYRWHISDYIPFEKSFRMTIENYSATLGPDDVHNAYSSVAYWYQMPGGTDFFQSYPVRERLIRTSAPRGSIEGESIFPVEGPPTGLSIQTAEESDEPLSNYKALRLEGPTGATFDLAMPAPAADRYRIVPKLVAPTNAKVEILKDGLPAGEKTTLAKGANPIAIRLTSKPEDAERAEAVIDYFELIPYRNYVPKWLVIGPFAYDGGKGFERAYAPEKGFDLKAQYKGVGGQTVKWQVRNANPRNGSVPVHTLFKPPENIVYYATCTVRSARAKKVDLFAGSDDGIKIWVNGRVVASNHTHRGYIEDSEHARVEMKEGENTVLVKVTNGAGPTEFGLRIADPEDEVTYGLPK